MTRRILLSIFLFFLFAGRGVFGQLAEIYVDVGTTLPLYVNHEHFEHRSPPGFLMNYGMAFRFKSESPFKIKGELGFQTRRLYRELEGFEFYYDLPLLGVGISGQVDLWRKYQFELGLRYGTYTRHLDRGVKSAGKLENGFRNEDLMIFGGFGGQVWKKFYLGIRYEYGMWSMLQHDVVTRDGELFRNVDELNYAAILGFVRIKFRNR